MPSHVPPRPQASAPKRLSRSSADANRHWSSVPQRKGIALSNPHSSVAQLATTVRNTTKAYKYDSTHSIEVGASTDAKIDPNDPKHGSAPGDGELKEVMEAFKAKNYRAMIRGHLMNGQLGGPGIASNLFPITSGANSKHKNFVESHVKKAVTDGNSVHYTVKVKSAFDIAKPEAEFQCKAVIRKSGKDTKEEVVEPTPIVSTPEVATTGSSDVKSDMESMVFHNNQLKAGWGEQGKGDPIDNGTGLGKITGQGHYAAK